MNENSVHNVWEYFKDVKEIQKNAANIGGGVIHANVA